MVLKLEQCKTQNDIEITIKYPLNKNKTVKHIASLISSIDIQIPCNSDEGIEIINSSEIYYIESVDDKTIIHCEKSNYLIKKRLYQIYEILKNVGFIQISKYCIINFLMLVKINPLANSHLEAVLKNGNRLFVTRKYLAVIKQKLRELL